MHQLCGVGFFIKMRKLYSKSQLQTWSRNQALALGDEGWTDFLRENVERAAKFILANIHTQGYVVVCGVGGNGADGLCLALTLLQQGCRVKVQVIDTMDKATSFFLKQLHVIQSSFPDAVSFSSDSKDYSYPADWAIVDAIVGTGILNPLKGTWADLVNYLNQLPNVRIALDIPSGFCAKDWHIQESLVFQAHYTIPVQMPYATFFQEENYCYVGDCLMQHLSPLDIPNEEALFHWVDAAWVQENWKPLPKFAHKNQLGHVRVIAGSIGKMGAAILSSKAAMRMGAGLVTASVPQWGMPIMQATIPEVMCEPNCGHEVVCEAVYQPVFDATLIGPGLGQAPETSLMLRKMLKEADKPLVLDADALNIIAHKKLHADVPPFSVITPHVGEFERLFGTCSHSSDRLKMALQMSEHYQWIIVLKGAYTHIIEPSGKIYINSTGNPGMATAGSGDTLAGIIAACMARGYASEVAATMGVYIHGRSGDIAANQLAPTALMAGDIIESLGQAVRSTLHPSDSR